MSERTAQSEYWDGQAGEHWTAFRQRYDELLGGFGHAAIDRADPQPEERYADIGCGTGATTLELGRRVGPEGFVIGIDLSGPMLETARERATEERLAHVRFAKADAARYRFEPSSLDGVLSRFGVMFFDEPVDAFGHVRGALRPDGRLVFVCWQEVLANEWITVPASAIIQQLPMPQLGIMRGPGLFSMSDAAVVRSILERAGFAEVEIESLVLPQRFGDNVDDAISFMMQTQIAASILVGADAQQVDAVVRSMRDTLEPHVRKDGVYLDGAAWLVSARAG